MQVGPAFRMCSVVWPILSANLAPPSRALLQAGALKERSARVDSLEGARGRQDHLLREREEASEEMRAEAERLRQQLDEGSRRLAEAEEALETGAASAEAEAAARALESAEASTRLGNATAEVETLKVRPAFAQRCVCVSVRVCVFLFYFHLFFSRRPR